jgi:hypothetical protein
MDVIDVDRLVADLGGSPETEPSLAALLELGKDKPVEAATVMERLSAGAADADPERASRWLVDAAALWAGTAARPKRAAQALRRAIEIAPGDDRALAELVKLYKENDKHRSLSRILMRRAETLLERAAGDALALRRAADAFAQLGDMLREPPLSSPAEAAAAYVRATATGAAPAATFKLARELLLAGGRLADAVALYATERSHAGDPRRLISLYREEAATRAEAGDRPGATAALRHAHAVDPSATELGADVAASILGRVEVGEAVPDEEVREAADRFVAASRWREAERCYTVAELWEDASWAAEKRGDTETALALLRSVGPTSAEDKARVALHEARLFDGPAKDPKRAQARYVALLQDLPADVDAGWLEKAARGDRGRGDGASEVAKKLEEAALQAADVRGLKVAFALSARALSGAPRGAELCRQAEVLTGLGADRPLAVKHAEAGLTGLSPAESAPLLERLAALVDGDEGLDLHERAAERATSDADRAAALVIAAGAPLQRATVPRLAAFFAAALRLSTDDRALDALGKGAEEGDKRRGDAVVRSLLVAALRAAEPDVIDGGRTQSGLLRRAAHLARQISEPDQAFELLGDALFARLEGALEEALAPLEDHTQEIVRLGAAARELRAFLEVARSREAAPPSARPPSQPPPPSARPPSLSLPPPPPPVPRALGRPAASHELSDPFPTPAPPRSGSTPPPPESTRNPPRRRLTGEELIASLFEAMHALDFRKDSLDAASFALTLAMDRLACSIGLAHFYDIDRREFVVVHARGPGALTLRRMRTSDADLLAAEALRSQTAVVVRDPGSDVRGAGKRWQVFRNADKPLTSIACARLARAGRYLGMLELCHVAGEASFAPGDDNALAYIAGRLTEFVNEHGIVLGEDE